MAKKKTKLQIAQEQAEAAVTKTNALIDTLGYSSKEMYDRLNEIQSAFDAIRNVPDEKKLEYEELKNIRLEWKHQVEKIEKDYDTAKVKAVGEGAAGAGAGLAVMALGPTAAMGIATTFGVASTGTAISTLSGAAATNAALAWLGGGALAAGGGGMAAGHALLALAGPIGWAIAGVALLGSGILFLKTKNDQKRLENIFTLISERDVKTYEFAMVELNERIYRLGSESGQLASACERIKSFGLDYTRMDEAQQFELGSYVNLMNASTQLLVNPIVGLLPKYSDDDYSKYEAIKEKTEDEEKEIAEKNLIIYLANLLYKIEIDDKDRKILWKSFKGNKQFLEAMKIKKKDFQYSYMEKAGKALDLKYQPV